MKNTSFSLSRIGGPVCLLMAFVLLISGKCNTNKQINIFSWCGTIIDGNFNNHVLLNNTLPIYGDYYYTLSRSGAFTSTNVLITYGGSPWNPGISGHLLLGGGLPGQNGTTFSCDIPVGTPCNATETFVIDIYEYGTNNLYYTCIFTIRNPPVVSNFKVYGKSTTAPTVITGCENKFADFWLNNIKLTYTGTGAISKYRVLVKQATSSGVAVNGGYSFTGNWINGNVPPILTLNSIPGTSANPMPATLTYFLITLETTGLCPGGTGSKTVLLRLNSRRCTRANSG